MTFGPPPNHIALYDPCSLSGLVYPRPPLYFSESEPDLYCHPDDSSVTSRLRDPQLKCNRSLSFNIDWATAFIVDHINKKTEAAETFKNVRIKATTLEREGLIDAIPYLIFNELDEALFAGHLKNAVYLDERNFGSDVSGATYNPNWSPVPRISIILNTDVLVYARARDIVAILIHHMIHAYFLVACGPQKEDEVEYGRLSHGNHFGKIMFTIRKLSAAHGKELDPLGSGHNLSDFSVYGEAWYKPRRRPSAEDRDKDEWYCSHCYSNVYEIPDSEIDKWYDKTVKPMSDQQCKAIRSDKVHIYNDRRHELESKPRARLPPSSKTVEFILKDKPILVEKKKIEKLISVTLAFESSKSRFFKIDKDIPEATFLRFLEFAHTGEYRPDPTNYSARTHQRSGPPIIKPSSARNESQILNDIHVARFGALAKFSEVRTYALKRMDLYGIMTEDPIAVLQAIYSGREPDVKLKEWARKFLVAGGRDEMPNIMKLENDNGPWRIRLCDAMDEFGGLENDVRKAWEEVWRCGWGGGGGGCGMGSGGHLLGSNMLTMGAIQSPFQQQRQQLLLGGVGGVGATTSGVVDALTSANAGGNPIVNALSQALVNQNMLSNQHLISNGAASSYEIQRERRELDRERRKVERERDRLKETTAQVQAAAMLESMMGRGPLYRGFIEDEWHM